ncbi:MAG: RES family NAD+ phosphorylase, partial [Thermoleophilia bacterium]|nr:RES family NAD+ phosphorylase [Thermoleophilia bacterium]
MAAAACSMSEQTYRFGWHTDPDASHPAPPPLKGPTDGGRWDSPDALYGVVYSADAAHVAVAEVLVSFLGPTGDNASKLAARAADSDEDAVLDITPLSGGDLAVELASRRLVELHAEDGARCVDLCAADVLRHIQSRHHDACQSMMGGARRLTAERLRLEPDRRVTRPIGSTIFHDLVGASPGCVGLRYPSRFSGSEFCWAVAVPVGQSSDALTVVGDPLE